MHPDPTAWTVLPHGPLLPLADNLWRVTGDVPGMSLKRQMIVIRRDEELVIHNAIALDEPGMEALLALGTPSALLVPSGIHRLDAPAWAQRFPELRVFTPAASRKKVAEVVRVDGTFDDFLHDDVVRLRTLKGTGDQEGAALVRSADGLTVLLNDVVFNMDRKTDPLGWFFTTLLGSAPGPRISRLAKWTLVRDRGILRRELTELAELPGLVRLIVAHEKVASGPDAAEALRAAVRYL